MFAAWIATPFGEAVIYGSLNDVFEYLEWQNAWYLTKNRRNALDTLGLWLRHGTLVCVDAYERAYADAINMVACGG